jgi:hypothetical protein
MVRHHSDPSDLLRSAKHSDVRSPSQLAGLAVQQNPRGVQTFFLLVAWRWLRPSTQSHVFLACCVSEGEFNSRLALSNDEWLATSR